MKKFGLFRRNIFLILLSLSVTSIATAETSKAAKKVAILPFSMHAPNELSYLQEGIRDMFASRLAWQGKVEVVDRSATNQALHGAKGDISLSDALKIGKSLSADYVLFGSLTGIGQSISIDSKIAPVSGDAEPQSFYAQTKTLDEVIPKINQFAQEMNQKVFARPAEKVQTATSDNETPGTRNPELLVPDTMIGGDKASYLNPNFIEVTPEGSLRQPGLWSSQTFPTAILGMDVGDLEGNGKQEIVTASFNKLTVFRKENQGLKTIATYNGGTTDHFLWVSVVDTNRDGKAEIYVTNLRTLNSPGAANTDSVSGDRGFTQELQSFGMTLTGGKLQVICDKVPYFLNGVEFPGRGKILIGQEKGEPSEGTFKASINEMQLRGNSLVPSVSVNLPSQCNIYNFVKADIKNDHSDQIVLIDKANKLVVLNPAGDQIWKSSKQYAATTNSFEGKVRDRRYNDVDLFAIPSPILVTDLNKDGIPEILVNQSADNAINKLLPEGQRYYDRGEIVSLSWDNLGMVENWKTREIGGMVTSIRLADLNHAGAPQLMASMVLAKDFLKLWDSKSTIFSYDLKVGQSKTKTAATKGE